MWTADIEIWRLSAINLVEVADGKGGHGCFALVDNPLNPDGHATRFVGPPIFYVEWAYGCAATSNSSRGVTEKLTTPMMLA